jgi:DNA-binding transcriptional MerR regulator
MTGGGVLGPVVECVIMNKKPSDLAKLLNISTPSLRRWCSEYAPYLSPGATPPKGKPRTFSENDERIFLLISNLRDAGLERDEIVQRLDAEQTRGWQGLPELPSEFSLVPIPDIPMDQAASHAYNLAQAAALQTQVQFLQQQSQELTLALEQARDRVTELEDELEGLRAESVTTERGLREEIVQVERQRQTQVEEIERRNRERMEQIQSELSQARAAVAHLEGRLSGYSLGRESPLNVGLLLAGAVLFGVVLVVIVFVIATLLG